MRAKQKLNLIGRILRGEEFCDCGSPATRTDEAGKPECQRCHELNSCAFRFHDRIHNLQMESMMSLKWEDQYG